MPSAASTFPRRGEIYLASLDKDRPVLILSVDSLNRYALRRSGNLEADLDVQRHCGSDFNVLSVRGEPRPGHA